MIVDNGHVALLEHSRDGLLLFFGEVRGSRMVQVAVLVDDVNHVELSAFVQAEVFAV